MKYLVSIIFIHYNTPKELLSAIRSLPKNLYYEIIVVDNNSAKKLNKKLLNTKVISNDKNLGYGAAINQAAKTAKGKFLLIANPDIIFLKNSLHFMVEKLAKNKNIGAIGPQYLDPKGNILQSFGGIPSLPTGVFVFSFLDKLFPKNKYSVNYWLPYLNRENASEVEHIGGACMLIRQNVFKKIGGFDERFFLYFEEADLCYRIKKLGYKVLYYPKAKIIHYIGRSTNNKQFIQQEFEKSRFRFFQKYHGTAAAIFAETFLRSSSFFSALTNNILKNRWKPNNVVMKTIKK